VVVNTPSEPDVAAGALVPVVVVVVVNVLVVVVDVVLVVVDAGPPRT
jgi:hypothetical protein